MTSNTKIVCIFISFLISCTPRPEKIASIKTNQYAQNFSILNSNSIETLQNGRVISQVHFTKIPNRIIIFSSSQLGFIKTLTSKKCIVGISNKNYFYDTSNWSHDVTSLGEMDQVNFEKLAKLNPDLVLLQPMTSPNKSLEALLAKTNIPFLITNEHVESHPLAMAEWIKGYGVIFHEEKKADSIFQLVTSNYWSIAKDSLKNLVKVMTGFPWQNQWFVSGSQSILSKMISDAGGKYFYQKNNLSNIPIDVETLFSNALGSSFWINIGDVSSLQEMAIRYPLSYKLVPYISHQCYNNNKRIHPNLSNDYWELGMVRPDLILSDLHHIFRQKHIDSLYFYKKLN